MNQKNIIFWTRQIWWKPSYNDISEEKALEILNFAYEKEIKWFDNAPIYGNWKSEYFLWEFIQKVWEEKRQELTIISKFWLDYDEFWKTFFDFRSDWMKKQLEKSLSLLQTSYIDIYLLHIPTENINIEEVLFTLNTFKEEWKIKSYWLCNTYWNLLYKFLNSKISQISYIEDFYNLIERKAEKDIFPFISGKNISFLAYSPLYRWVLTSQTFKNLLEKNEAWIRRNSSQP